MERELSNPRPGQPWQNGGNSGYHTPGSPALSHRERDREQRPQDRDRDRSREIERGRDREMEPRRSNERKHSQQGSSRAASGQVRLCKKCGEPLTGQFVRALDGTFHLDCFRCQVGPPCCYSEVNTGSILMPSLGLWPNCRVQILPSRRRQWRPPVPPLRDGLLPPPWPSLLPLWRCSSRIIHYRTRPQIPCRPLHMFPLPDGLWCTGQLLRARWPSLLPLPLLNPVRTTLQRLQNRHPQAVCRDFPQQPEPTLASRVLYDTQILECPPHSTPR